jgi:8-amino-7-oxononanoate synthase
MPVPAFDEILARRLDALRESGLWRELRRIEGPAGTRVRVGDRTLLNFSGNDYLGLASHPALIEAEAVAARDFGAGATASRLVCGSLSAYHRLEEVIADFKGAAAALSFATGHAAAMGTIPALIGDGDVVVIDRLAHACCVDAARLSGAKLRVFRHNDLEDLERILRWSADQPRNASGGPHVLVVTESLFSMDGDFAPLREIIELKDRYGAWLMLDEAHSTGVLGPGGRGLAASLGLSSRVEIQMGTLGKAIGASGGFIAGSRALIDTLVNRARTFLFSTAPVPAAAVAATAGIEIVRGPEGDRLRRCLDANVILGTAAATAAGFEVRSRSQILPLMIGDERRALEVAASLRASGVLAPAIRHPTVARGEARIRVTFSAAHSAADLDSLAAALKLAAAPR